MFKLKKHYQTKLLDKETGVVQVHDPLTGKTFKFGRKEVLILKGLAKFPSDKVAKDLNLPEAEVKSFFERLLNDGMLEKVDFGPAIVTKEHINFHQDDDKLLIEDDKNNKFYSLGYEETVLFNELINKPFEVVITEKKLNPQEVQEFIVSLASKDLLTHPSIPGLEKKLPNKNLLSLLVQRFKLGNPDTFFEWLDSSFGWLWKSPFIGIHLGVIIVGLFLSIAQSEALLSYGFPQIMGNQFLNSILFLSIVSAILALHEFAHGLTLKSFGGRVPEIGLFLMYGFPSAYTNVTDSYKLKNTSEKMWVILAGILFQAWVGFVALLIWTFSTPHTLPSDLSYMVYLASFMNLLVNLNPLIKLDGYYLLTLALKEPNLRSKSWNFIFGGFQGAKSFSQGFLYLVFGILSVLYTGFLVLFLFSFLFKSGLENIPYTSLLIVGLLFLAAFTPLPREITPADSKDEKSKATKKEKSSLNFPMLFILILIGGLLFIEIPYQIGGEVEVKPANSLRAEIHSPMVGIVKKVYAKSGDYVKAGQKLVEIVDWSLLDSLSNTTGGNPLAGNSAPRLSTLSSDIQQKKIENEKLKIELQKAQLTAQSERKKADTFLKLAESGAYPKTQAEQARFNAEIAEREILRIQEEMKLNNEVQNASRLNYSTLSGQINFLRSKSSMQVINSPISGYVLTEDTDLKIGSAASPEVILFTIADLKEVEVKIKVPQEDLPSVKEGQPVILTIRAFPGDKFKGKVAKIAISNEDPKSIEPGSTKEPGRRKWNVTMIIQNPSLNLKPGMTGYAYIDSAKKMRVWELMMKEIYRVLSLEKFAVFRESLQKASF